MKNKDIEFKLTKGSLTKSFAKFIRLVKPYIAVLFFLLIALAYGFVILRINALSKAEVDPSAVSEQVKASPTPRIDANAIKQLETLKDNSVNVQTLFEESRTNPFQE